MGRSCIADACLNPKLFIVCSGEVQCDIMEPALVSLPLTKREAGPRRTLLFCEVGRKLAEKK